MKYSSLQYRAVFSFARDSMALGKLRKDVFYIKTDSLKSLCEKYLQPVGLRMIEHKSAKSTTISIERNPAE